LRSNDKTKSLFSAPQGSLCLAFANTSYWRGSASPTETLQGSEDLFRWATEAGGVAPELAKACRVAWQPRQAAARLAEAIVLREAIYRLFSATSTNLRMRELDLAVLNEALRAGPQRSHLSIAETQCKWLIDEPRTTLAVLLAPVVWSAADLLTSPCLTRVRACANERCRQLFLDESKGGNRRWCLMSSCGNQAKAHRHYLRHREIN
jgi:predicted RNA-binding Zn ribbon-like protein